MILRRKKIHYIIDILCLILLISTSIYLIISWSELPEKIPGHYDAYGNIDRWGSKTEIIVMPIFAWFMFISISILERFPQVWNTGVKVTEANAYKVYSTLYDMIITLKIILTLVFSFLIINSIHMSNLPSIFLPVMLFLVFGDLIYHLLKLHRVK
jgi:uncharacterized membrane protein